VNIGTDKADDGSQTFTIWNSRTATIKNGNDTVTVEKGNQTIGVSKGNQDITVDQGNHTLTVSAGTSDVEAGTHIMLKVGSSSIKIEAAKITIQSPEIALTADGKISIGAPLSDVSGSGSLKLSGAIVKIN
jgi:type VI secretion system secreted protein VgrG